MIKKTAVEMAHEIFEEMSSDNTFHKIWPNRKWYVDRKWSVFIPAARAALTEMLKGNYPESTKEAIFEALLLDKTLPQGNDTSVRPMSATAH